MITQAEVETYRENVQNAFDNLFATYDVFRRRDLYTPDHIFRDLKSSLSEVGTFRAGKVFDLSQIFVGFRVDDVDVDDLEESSEREDFITRMEIARESIVEVQRYFDGALEESRYAIRCHETGDVIDTFSTFEEAESRLREYETTDKKDGTFEEGFYEIYDNATEEILVCKEWFLDNITTTKRVSASGGALKISITSECNAMGLGVGDYVEITIRRVK